MIKRADFTSTGNRTCATIQRSNRHRNKKGVGRERERERERERQRERETGAIKKEREKGVKTQSVYKSKR